MAYFLGPNESHLNSSISLFASLEKTYVHAKLVNQKFITKLPNAQTKIK